jgi:acyl-CoA synthetase (AMP-forming)/AMP-acid ligase II
MNNLVDLLEQGGTDRLAVVVVDGPTLSYGQLRQLVREGADRLAQFGVGPGDRVAMALANGPEAIVMFLAAAVGAIACPLNPSYKEDEFRFYLEDIGARILLVPRGGGQVARQAAPRAPPSSKSRSTPWVDSIWRVHGPGPPVARRPPRSPMTWPWCCTPAGPPAGPSGCRFGSATWWRR